MAAIHAPLPLRSSHVAERSNHDGLEYSAVWSVVEVIFVAVMMNVKPFHITIDGCGALAIQGKMLNIFTLSSLDNKIRYLCGYFL